MKGLKSFILFSFILCLRVNAQSVSIPLLPTSASSSSTSDTSASSTPPPSSTSSVDSTSTSSTSSASTTSQSSSSTTQPPPSSATSAQSVQLTTSDGVEVTVTVTGPATSSSSSTPSSAPDSGDNSSSGLGTGSIVGLSVAGGIALIGIIGFFIWKFTRKRFSDFDDNEAIKWPDLNTHGAGASDSHPLPVNNTGRSGFDTGSEGSLSRVPSTNYSTPDFNSGTASDPYAVPPLPHLNPNQPYRDDPGAVGAYYDPYRGPIPGTIEHGAPGAQGWSGEAIPMTQMNAAGRMSPGPNAAYGAEPAYEYDMGRQSPGPQMAYGGGRVSPGPQAVYGGRVSPGPHAAYGGAVSPTPGGPTGYEGYPGR